jgi:hypothetical protein
MGAANAFAIFCFLGVALDVEFVIVKHPDFSD